jgi:thioredoxin 1
LFLILLVAGCCQADEPPAKAVIKRPVVRVLAFTAEWCEPCHRQRPIVDAIRKSGVNVTNFDADRDQTKLDRYRVSALPTYIVLRDGREVFRSSNATMLRTYLAENCGAITPSGE